MALIITMKFVCAYVNTNAIWGGMNDWKVARSTNDEQRFTIINNEHSITIVEHDNSAQSVVCDYRMSRRGLAWETPQVRKHGITRQHNHHYHCIKCEHQLHTAVLELAPVLYNRHY